MAREYIDELGDGTINPETSGVDSQATDNGTHVKTLAPIYYTPATIDNDGKATRETPVTIKSALDAKANDDDVVHKAGEEVITGRKIFTDSFSISYDNAGEMGYSSKILGQLLVGTSYNDWPSSYQDGHHYREWTIKVPYLMGFGALRIKISAIYLGTVSDGSSGTLEKTLVFSIGNNQLCQNYGYYTIVDDGSAADFRISDLIINDSSQESNKYEIKIRTMHPEYGYRSPVLSVDGYGMFSHFEDIELVSETPEIVTGETYDTITGTNSNPTTVVTHQWATVPKIQNSEGKDILVDGDIVQSSTNGNLSVLGTDVEVYSHPTQTAYTSKGTATKVPQITTDSTGHVTSISEVTISGVTPSSHASTATTYGIGTTSNYGHVKLATGDMNGATNTDGVAVSKNHTHSQYAPKASPALTGTPTAPTAADGTNTTQIATTAFVQSAVAQGLSVSDAMVYKGTITLGATSPGGLTVAADKGHTYKVVANGNTKEGYVDGVKVEAGDMVICNTDSTAAATSSNYSTIAAKWDFVQGNTDGVVVGPASATSGNVVVFDGATGKLVKDGGKLGTAAFKDVASSGNASTTQVVMGNDTRLTDARTPTSHAHGNISNAGAITSDTAVASGDKLVITDSSDSNKVARSGIAFDGSSDGKLLSKKGTWESAKEAYIEWGGRNITGDFSAFDAAFVSLLSANRFAYLKPAGITVEYTRDGGTTWIDYGLSDSNKRALFTTSYGVAIGKADSNNKATTGDNWQLYKLRITLTAPAIGLYTLLKKMVILVSTSGSVGSQVRVRKMTRTSEEGSGTWEAEYTMGLSGWSGYNVLNNISITPWSGASTQKSQHSKIEFIFEATAASSSDQYNGLNVLSIYGFGGVGWTCPSNMAKTGHLYNYDGDQNATFPANVTATKFIGPLQGNADTATKLSSAKKLAVSLSNTSTDTTFDGSADVTNIKVSGQLADANIASAATWNAKQDAITYMTATQENAIISELGEL